MMSHQIGGLDDNPQEDNYMDGDGFVPWLNEMGIL